MWIKIDEEYLQYMKLKGDRRIPNQDYGANRYKPFFKLFSIGKLSYITQINHAQSRHEKMREMDDFSKLYQRGKLVGVVNLNYMFPILDKHIQTLTHEDIKKIIDTGDQTKADRYIQLLIDQEHQIRFKNVSQRAALLYEKSQSDRLETRLFNRCLDFKHLEKTTLQYELDQVFSLEETRVTTSKGLFFVDIDDERYTMTYDDFDNVPLLKEVHEYGLEMAKNKEITDSKNKTM